MADPVLVRAVHVLAASVLVGGAVVVAAARAPASAARVYELVFWPTLAVGVATGVGNLGAGFGIGDPVLVWKLAAVVVVLVVSLARVALLAFGGFGRPLAWAHGATATLLAGVILLAVRLAHA